MMTAGGAHGVLRRQKHAVYCRTGLCTPQPACVLQVAVCDPQVLVRVRDYTHCAAAAAEQIEGQLLLPGQDNPALEQVMEG